ncbi:MAG: hypothetical protein H6581_28155 [Bacteroidia bacterium]|nr:hypothetical protein [Bacteroidia bacterium]
MKSYPFSWILILLAFPLLSLECGPGTGNSGNSLTLTVDTQNPADARFEMLARSDQHLHKYKLNNEMAVDLVTPWVTDHVIPRKVNHVGDELDPNDWTTVYGERQKFVGMLARYKMYNSHFVQETDLNLMVIPNQPGHVDQLKFAALQSHNLKEVHLYRINDPYPSPQDLCPEALNWYRNDYLEKGVAKGDHKNTDPKTDYCITLEAELTPWMDGHKALDRHFFPTFALDDPQTTSHWEFLGTHYTHKNLQFSPHFTNQYPAIGLYGPMCMDDRHGNRPEIHPWDWIWWMKLDSSNTEILPKTWMVGLLWDDADRFQKQAVHLNNSLTQKIKNQIDPEAQYFYLGYRKLHDLKREGHFNQSIYTDADRAAVDAQLKLKPWAWSPRTGTLKIPFFIPLEAAEVAGEYARFNYGITIESRVVKSLRADSLPTVGDLPGNKVSPVAPQKALSVQMGGKEVGHIQLRYQGENQPEGVAAWVQNLRFYDRNNQKGIAGFLKVAASTEKVWTAAVTFSDQSDGKVACGDEQRLTDQQVSASYNADLTDYTALKNLLRASHTRKTLEIDLSEPLPEVWWMEVDLSPMPKVFVDHAHLSTNLYLKYDPTGYSFTTTNPTEKEMKIGSLAAQYLQAQKKITLTLEVSNNLWALLQWGELFNPEIPKISNDWKRYDISEFICMAPDVYAADHKLLLDYCLLVPWPKEQLNHVSALQTPVFDTNEGRIVFPERHSLNAPAGWILWENALSATRLANHLQRIDADFGIKLKSEIRQRLQNQYTWITPQNGGNLETASYGYYPLVHVNPQISRPERALVGERSDWTFSTRSMTREVDLDKRLRQYMHSMPEWTAPVALYFDADAVLKGTVNNCTSGVPVPGQPIRRCNPQVKVDLEPRFGSPDLRFHQRVKVLGDRTLKAPYFVPDQEGNPNGYVKKLNELLETSASSARSRIKYFGSASPFTFKLIKSVAIGRDDFGIPDTTKLLSCQSCLTSTLNGKEITLDFNNQIMCSGAAWLVVEITYQVGDKVLDRYRRTLIIDPCTYSSDDFQEPDFTQVSDPNPCLPRPGEPDPCRSGFDPARLQRLGEWWQREGLAFQQGQTPWTMIPARMGDRLRTATVKEGENEERDPVLQTGPLVLPRIDYQENGGNPTLIMTISDYVDLGFQRKNEAMQDLTLLKDRRIP